MHDSHDPVLRALWHAKRGWRRRPAHVTGPTEKRWGRLTTTAEVFDSLVRERFPQTHGTRAVSSADRSCT